jgi:hypothetical protein
MRYAAAIVAAALALAVPGHVRADWDPGDGHKMHHPQLPDPYGWDVMFTDPFQLADDWMCSKSGPVSDIHLWFSSQGDEQFAIETVNVAIYGNGPDPDGAGPAIGQPGGFLWSGSFDRDAFTQRVYDVGQQGFYNPFFQDVAPDDHFVIFQINIVDIPRPFEQTEGDIYWLVASVWEPSLQVALGWKTSRDYFGSPAMFFDVLGTGQWQPLFDPDWPSPPLPELPLDLAFVITPEPATLSLLALGGLALIRRKRH